MKEELEKKINNELTDDEMNNVSGGVGSESAVETCPRCSANVSVLRKTQSKNGCFWKTINGKCEKCGYVIDVIIEW